MLWLLPVGVLAISSASILIRITPADSVSITFWRLAFATIVTLAINRGRLRASNALWSSLAGFFLSLHFLAWITSLFYTTVAASTTLVNTHPLFLLGLAKLTGEEVDKSSLLGIAVSTLGIAIMFSGEIEGDLFGMALALAGSLAFAFYLAIGKRVRSRLDTLNYTAIAYGSAALFTLLFATASNFLGARVDLFNHSLYAYLLMLLIALVPMLLGHTVFNFLLGRYRALTIAAATLGEPVGATALAAAVLGEVPNATTLVGAALVLSGISLVIRGEGRG